MPKVTVLGGAALGKWLETQGRTLVNEINASMKEAPKP